ncbi:hypothetical protein [Acidiferrobacter sp.]|uniref:hypothetical protein n=1 Tax=Acidiferrobacter sp. TaxID=1872107 RepID=UPI00260E3CFE|nr:hypothetical protein [Acidiferrobacter sp.]
MDSKALLSEYLAKLPDSPDAFPFFYRRLVTLRFPIEVAEILEMRYLCQHAIDESGRYDRGDEWGEFTARRMADMDHIGVQKATHRERLSRLLLLFKDYHDLHKLRSMETEATLQAAWVDNCFAQERSTSYGKTAGMAALIAAMGSLLLSPRPLVLEGLTLLLAYVSVDSFYSLALLRRQQRRLNEQLSEILRRRVRMVNWRAVVRQTSAILGYTQPLGGEAFRLEQEHETLDEPVEIDGR